MLDALGVPCLQWGLTCQSQRKLSAREGRRLYPDSAPCPQHTNKLSSFRALSFGDPGGPQMVLPEQGAARFPRLLHSGDGSPASSPLGLSLAWLVDSGLGFLSVPEIASLASLAPPATRTGM